MLRLETATPEDAPPWRRCGVSSAMKRRFQEVGRVKCRGNPMVYYELAL